MVEFWLNIQIIGQVFTHRAENQPKIVISPLDWGLGHATRLVSLVSSLLESGACIWLAGSGNSGNLLQQAFPDLPFLEAPGWKVRYAASGPGFFWSMAGQGRAFLRSVDQDRAWMAEAFERFQWDWVISDNRYGFYHPRAENILITHQLYPRSGKSWFPDRALAWQVGRLARPFQQIWVPDAAESPSLSGRLSHSAQGRQSDSRIRFIGPVSRFSMQGVQSAESWLASNGLKPNGFVLAVVSGPEPQRSLMESRILQTYVTGSMPLVLLRGLPLSTEMPRVPEGVMVFNHLDTGHFQILGMHASAIVCRAGYSSIMDLVCLGRPALLVPTPGQAEQEYLAAFLSGQGIFPCMEQESFALPVALRKLESFRGGPPAMDFLQHRTILHQCLQAYAEQRRLLP